MTSISSSSMRSQSANERRRSGRAKKRVTLIDRPRACRRILAVRERMAKACAASWSLRVSITARRSGSASASPRSSANETAVFGARDVIEVGPEWIVPLAPLDVGRRHRRERQQRAEPGVWRHAGDHISRRIGEPGENAWGQGASDGFRHRIVSLDLRPPIRSPSFDGPSPERVG